MENIRLINWVSVLLIISGAILLIVLFVPMWKIELNAPQYPEGLILKIYPNKLGGSVDIINGLNHYIGMKTLHTKDFIEFKVLPYIIVFFALGCFLVAFLNKRKWLIVLTSVFVIFGIVAMIDFWRWEYNYGHDLDPEAAIRIPGMAYQPPLIGYKQLLNFGAYSVPDTGGYIFVVTGLLLVSCIIIQVRHDRKQKKKVEIAGKKILPVSVLFMLFFQSCDTGPQPIKLGTDACSFCKMTIADNRFGGEIITKKNKIFKFDDIQCILSFQKSNTVKASNVKQIYLVDFNRVNKFIEAARASLLKSEELHTPMGSNVAAFAKETDLGKATEKFKGTVIVWKDLSK